MYLKREDISTVYKSLGLAMMEMKADTVMLPRTGRVRPMNIYYHNETAGWGAFLISESNASRFEAVDARTLFTLLHGLNSSQLAGRPVVRGGVPSRELIDLSSMLEDIGIVADIHFAMKQVWKNVGAGDAAGILRIGSEALAGIKADLAALCKDDYGVAEAKRLWSIYRPVIGQEVPNLEVRVGRQNGVESNKVLFQKGASGDAVSDKKIEDGRQKRRPRRP